MSYVTHESVRAVAPGTFPHDTESHERERLVWIWDLEKLMWYSTCRPKEDLRSDGLAMMYDDKVERYEIRVRRITMWRPFGFFVPGF